MSDRRFTDKPDLDPTAVFSLADDHAAMREDRTLFPSTVVTVTEDAPDRILVSGHNNRKLGKTVAKGIFKGYALYSLSLEERATCPGDCSVRNVCYGNGMQKARRHRIGDPEIFYDRLGMELAELCDAHDGVLVRLHVLGDFPDVEYVAFWKEALDEWSNLACYGYTHRLTKAWGGDEIGDAIEAVKDAHPDRFRIRWSCETPRPDGAVVINRVPDKPRVDEGLVCPAQTDATACCATCGLCWEPNARQDTIAFIRHGRRSADIAASSEAQPPVEGVRTVAPIAMPTKAKPADLLSASPSVENVAPTDLLVEPKYQRDLSGRSITLIRKIVTGWDWAKFKPPIVARTAAGLFIIDGQHTAIAAATHSGISEIPVLIVGADEIEKRAESFVSHNRDRLVMSPLQVFHAEVTAGNQEAIDALEIIVGAGGNVPRSTPPKGKAQPGDVVAVKELRKALKAKGRKIAERIMRIAVASDQTPIATTVILGLRYVLLEPRFAEIAVLEDNTIASALGEIADLEQTVRAYAGESGQNRYRACALLIERNCRAKRSAA